MMLHTRFVKLILALVAFVTGAAAEIAFEAHHWLTLAIVATVGALLCQYLLDLYFSVRLAEQNCPTKAWP